MSNPPEAERELAEAILALGVEFARDLPRRIDAVATAIAWHRRHPDDPTAAQQLEQLVHKLCGTAGSYGFNEVSVAAGAIEEALVEARRSGGAPAQLDVDALQIAATAAAEGQPAPPVRAPAWHEPTREASRLALLILDPDPASRAALASLTEASGLRALACADAPSALALAREEHPVAAVIDTGSSAGDAAFGLASTLRAEAGAPMLPIAYVSSDPTFESRIGAAATPGAIHMERPVSAEAFALVVNEMLASRLSAARGRPGRVLICDDDEAFARLIACPLKFAGYEVTMVHSARALLATLEEARADLVLLDVELPDLSGFDICRVLRATPRWRDIPVMFLTGYAGIAPRMEAFRLGADDFLGKSVTNEELLARVAARLQRARELRERADRDPLTGLPTRRAFEEQGAARLAEARRHGRPLSVALIDLDHLKTINDKMGHAAGDRALLALAAALGRALRLEDVRARWGGDEFVAVCVGATAAEAHQALERAREVLAQLRAGHHEGELSFSEGVASFPEDGESLDALLQLADQRLYERRRDRRAKVH